MLRVYENIEQISPKPLLAIEEKYCSMFHCDRTGIRRPLVGFDRYLRREWANVETSVWTTAAFPRARVFQSEPRSTAAARFGTDCRTAEKEEQQLATGASAGR